MGMLKHSQNLQSSKFPTSFHQSFLQFDFNNLIIKVSYKVKFLILMGMIKHSQIPQSNKFVISLQYLKKEVRNGANILHVHQQQGFYKLALLF